MLEAVLAAIAANAVMLGVLGFLFKSLIGHLLEKDLSKFKQSLEDRAFREIEAYKAELDKERLCLQISYGGIFEKQANAILKLYRGVVALERAASDAIHFEVAQQNVGKPFVRPGRRSEISMANTAFCCPRK